LFIPVKSRLEELVATPDLIRLPALLNSLYLTYVPSLQMRFTIPVEGFGEILNKSFVEVRSSKPVTTLRESIKVTLSKEKVRSHVVPQVPTSIPK
jgi:hypothetical protein